MDGSGSSISSRQLRFSSYNREMLIPLTREVEPGGDGDAGVKPPGPEVEGLDEIAAAAGGEDPRHVGGDPACMARA